MLGGQFEAFQNRDPEDTSTVKIEYFNKKLFVLGKRKSHRKSIIKDKYKKLGFLPHFWKNND